MSTFNEHEAVLRRALMAAAEQVEPSPEGLQRIQARLRPPQPFIIAWLQGVWTDLILRAPEGLQSLGARLARAAKPLWERIGPQRAANGGRQPMGWIRPVAAMSVAVFVIGAGAYVAFSDAILTGAPAGSNTSSTSGHGNGGNGAPAPHGSGSVAGNGSTSTSTWPPSSPTASPCTSSPGAAFQGPGPSSSPSTSPSSSPSSSVSPSPSDSASASPSPSNSAASGSSSGPSAGPSSAGQSVIRTTAYVQLTQPGSVVCTPTSTTPRKRSHSKVHAKPGTASAISGPSRRGTDAVD